MNDIFTHCKDGNMVAVKVWLDNTENDLNQGDDHLFSPLHWASREGHLHIVDILINRGARVNSANMGDDTPLHNAAQMGHLEIMKKLIKQKADVNAINEHGNTPLHYACFGQFAVCAEELVANGGLVTICNKYGQTPLSRARPQLSRKLKDLASTLGQDMNDVQYKNVVSIGTTRTRAKNGTLKHENVDLRQLNLKGKIASSHSGETWRGRWGQQEIVAKILKIREITSRKSREFHEEYLRLRIFSHPNVLPVMGIVNTPKTLATVSPHVSVGSLYNVLHESTVTVDHFRAVLFATNIANGISFLHSLDPIIPRLHINSKHIMIEDGMNCRINMGDVKFSFQEPGKLYNPAWMAPEVLQRKHEEINRKSADMWSFSILLWEMVSREVPFSDLSNMECGMRIALEGMRVSIPPGISPHICKLMKICMNEDAAKRPKFDMILPILQKMSI
uniref:Integrin-linked protein kinase-like n=1 Tax=Phallusia mammillata TaxID=59560 RepID=A0A6F9DFU5_9ASCI|nr:integrin-linked protein kinase-like [Phallusia mammillata]